MLSVHKITTTIVRVRKKYLIDPKNTSPKKFPGLLNTSPRIRV